MSKFTSNKKIIDSDMLISECPSGFEWAKSFNQETAYVKGETKYLIVGTLTPPDGRGEMQRKQSDITFSGYFYCSRKNDMYMFLDRAFKNRTTKLTDLKQALRTNWDPFIKDKIIEELKNRKVAFLDVVDQAYVLPATAKHCSSDNTINSYKPDYEAFKKIDFSGLTIIPNSKNAEKVLRHILKKIGKDNMIVHDVIPQMMLGYKRFKGEHKDKLIQEWIDALNLNP